MNRLNLYFSILLLFLPLLIFSQKKPIKYGKLSNEEKTIEKSELDKDANAIILFDFGEINFEGATLIIERHTRIKILNTNGLHQANIEIPFFAKNNREKVTKVKAQTLNIDKDGTIEKTKVSKSDFFTVDLNKNWKSKRFAFPNVKPGSIIEYVYRKTSKDAVSLEEWNFQNDLPTLTSHLHVLISEGLDYKIVYNGDRLLNKYGNENRNTWSLENLPPLEEENFCPNIDDYKESIRFQLASYVRRSNIPGGGLETVDLMSTWEKLAKDILSQKEYIGILGQLGKRKKTKQLLKQIISENDADLEKVKKIYSFIQNRISWNGKYRLFPDQNFIEIFESNLASSCEINLVLVQLLKNAGLDANPLIISTKTHGRITKVYPLYNQFNHVLAQVKIGEKDILMDATSPFRSYRQLADEDLNPSGYLLSKKEPRWINIPLPKKTKTIVVTELKFLEEELQYKTAFAFFKHHAEEMRRAYDQEGGKNSFITKHLLDYSGGELVLDSFTVKNTDKLDKPFSVVCYFKKPLDEGLDANYIYIEPFLKKHFFKNPFTKSYRYLPIDFLLPSSEKFIFNLSIPEGYELAEEPESNRFTIENNKCDYNFLFKKTSNSLCQLSSEFIISNPLIYPTEYSSLREMFNQIIRFQSMQLVLKKK